MISGYFNLGEFSADGGTIPVDVEKRINEYLAYRMTKPIFFVLKNGVFKIPCVAPMFVGTEHNGVIKTIFINLAQASLMLNFSTHSYTVTFSN